MSGDVNDAAVVVSAGLLDGAGALSDELTVDTATGLLRDLLGPSALWERAGRDSRTYADLVADHSVAPVWTAPAADVSAELAGTLRTAWDEVVGTYHPKGDPVVRVAVFSPESADALHDVADVGDIRIVPFLALHAERFVWRWPIRVAVAPGPRAAQWLDELRRADYRGELYEVVAGDDGDQVELLIAGADSAVPPYRASCVVVLGEAGGPPPADLLALAVDVRPALAVGAVSDDVLWFPDLVEHLAHDVPVDVAVTRVLHGARVAADPTVADLTAVGRWAVAMSDPADPADVDAICLAIDEHTFDRERHGARAVIGVNRGIARRGGNDRLDVRRNVRMANGGGGGGPPPQAAAPPETGAEPTAAAPPKARRLVATVSSDAGGKRRDLKKALLPQQAHLLSVAIAVPRRGQLASSGDFPETEVKDEDGMAELQVEARWDAAGLHDVRTIYLPTGDRSLPSTPAEFPFTTPADGTPFDITVTVTYQGRPLQQGHLYGMVRADAGPEHRIRFADSPLSAAPEPADTMSAAAVTLATEGSMLRRHLRPDLAPVDIGFVEKLLDELEATASGVLTADPPPASLGERAAVDLLVDLARFGAQLRDRLVPLAIEPEGTIALSVGVDSPVLPLEIAYDGPAPRRGSAKLCGHATGAESPPALGKGCAKASERVVCPYAFWGMNRVIARTFVYPPGTRVNRRAIGTTTLLPVLYGAALKADEDCDAGAVPSQLLEDELVALVGRAQLVRVTSWRGWKSRVRLAPPPQLMVVLGHTEIVKNETTIQIGSSTPLARPDVGTDVVGTDVAPLVVLLACATAAGGDTFGGLPSAFTRRGAAAVVATLSKLRGPHGARAAAAVVRALRSTAGPQGIALGTALTEARRGLVADGYLLGLLLVSHGEIDLKVVG